MNTCQTCGEPLVWSGRGRPPTKFCSPKCKFAGTNQKQKAARRAAIGERRCLECGTPIPETMTLKAKCCSRECGIAYQNHKRAAEKRVRVLASRQPCAQCGSEIPEDRKAGSIYCSAACKKLANDAAWRLRSPHYMRQYLYGISQEQYESLMTEQDGKCAICGSPDWPAPIKAGSPHVDHDRETGHVRGLLCGHCNTGIGQLGHDPARLRAAADYLERVT